MFLSRALNHVSAPEKSLRWAITQRWAQGLKDAAHGRSDSMILCAHRSGQTTWASELWAWLHSARTDGTMFPEACRSSVELLPRRSA